MRKSIMLFAAIFMMAVFSGSVLAQTSASEVTSAGAKLIVPMTLTETAPLHFGTINVLLGAGGTCLLPSNNTTRVFSAGLAASAVAPLATNAAYDVTGTMNVTYALSLPGTVTVTETVGAIATMDITLLTARFLGAPADDVVSVLSATGTDSFTLGGTLTVDPGQVAGIYAGTFTVTVDYN
jgi:hypothetical protein